MKKKLKLSEINKKNVIENLVAINGGSDYCGKCFCSCCYWGEGGSSTHANKWANTDEGLVSKPCPETT